MIALAPFTLALALRAAPTLAAAAAAAAAAPVATVESPLPHPMQVDKLDNGLTVVTVPFDSPGIVAYFTLVQAGSRDEVEPGKSGYAHLFEHLMFRGTDAVPAAEYGRRILAMGAEDNAFTSEDITVYTTTLPKDGLEDVIKLNADRFQHLHVAQDKYKDETGAVLGERNKVFASPEAQMEEALTALMFKVHTYGHTTIGSKRDVEDMPNQYEYSRQFFKRFYTPDDCVIFVVGDFDRAKTLSSIKEAYGSWAGKRAKSDVKAEPEQKAPRAKQIPWRGPTEPLLELAYRTPSARVSLSDAAALATMMLAAFGESSDLYQRLVVKEQKVLGLDVNPRELLRKDPSVFDLSAKLKPETSFDEVIGAVQRTVESFAKGEAPAAKIEAARSHLVNGLVLGVQTPGALASQLAYAASVTGDPHGFELWARALAAVKPEDVARVAKTLTPAHRDVVTLVTVPDGKGDAPKAAGKGGAASDKSQTKKVTK